jgi:hypothetical protein
VPHPGPGDCYNTRMGLVVDLGLSRYYDHASEDWPKAVIALVEAGFTTLLRDVITASSDLVGAKVFEARRVGAVIESRWLTPTEAKPLLDELTQLYKNVTSYAAFSWDELEELGVEGIQDLAVLGDGTIPSPYGKLVLPGHKERTRVMDLNRANRLWDDWNDSANTVCHLMAFALRHRMAVHSA